MPNYITNSGVFQIKTSRIGSIQIWQNPLRACRSCYVLAHEKVPCFVSGTIVIDESASSSIFIATNGEKNIVLHHILTSAQLPKFLTILQNHVLRKHASKFANSI